MKSKVKWFNDDKGFGFIEYSKDTDIFVHYSSIRKDGYKTLSKGQEVNFNLINTDKGYQAIDVEIARHNKLCVTYRTPELNLFGKYVAFLGYAILSLIK